MTAFSQEKPIAWTGIHIVPITSKEVSKGTIVIHKGKIVAVGPQNKIKIPEDAVKVDGKGKTVMPGLICTHSHLGGFGGGDGSGPIQPEVRIFDSLNVHDAGFRRAVAGGLTSLNIMPGSGHLMSGQTIYVKLRKDPRTIDDFAYKDEKGKFLGGMKMANGTNSMRGAPFPGTRGKSAALVRQKFIQAQEYQAKVKAAKGDKAKLPPRDLGMEAMVEVLEGKRIVHHHTHRHDDIITVLRLSKEFNFRVVLHHVSEGWKVAKEIAEAGAACSAILIDSPGGKLEAIDLVFETGAILEKAGVPVAFHTDDWITDSRLFLRMPALAVRAGMSRKAALASLTIEGAKMMDLDSKIGSLEVGKDADIVILNGDPLSVYTKVLETYVEGKKVFDRSLPKDYLHAVGGFGAGASRKPYQCCYERGED